MLLSSDPVVDSDTASLVVASVKAQRQTMEMISTDIKPQIEFTLPSPTIGIENLPVVDPPWMPKFETKVENLDIRRRGQTILSATQSHRQQPTVLVRSILFDEKDKKRKDRDTCPSLPCR